MIALTPSWRRRIARDFAALLIAKRRASVDPIILDDIPSPKRKGIVGEVVLDFVARGFIQDTQTFERSRRPHAHACPKRIWRLVDGRGLRRWRKSHPLLTPPPAMPSLFDGLGVDQ